MQIYAIAYVRLLCDSKNKKSMRQILSILILCSLFSCTNDKKVEKQNTQNIQKDLWTEKEKDEFIQKNSETDFEKHTSKTIINEIKYQLTYQQLLDTINTDEFKRFLQNKEDRIRRIYYVEIPSIAGKNKKEIEMILGKPNKKEKVNPSKTPCPCDKYYYINNLVEIVFINGVADWITVNNTRTFVKVGDPTIYRSVDHFDDYSYIKVKTK